MRLGMRFYVMEFLHRYGVLTHFGRDMKRRSRGARRIIVV
jgi:hypothetical protein